jgi:hypothetical protein
LQIIEINSKGFNPYAREGDALRLASGGNERRKTRAQTSEDHDKVIDQVALSEHEVLFMNGACFQ